MTYSERELEFTFAKNDETTTGNGNDNRKRKVSSTLAVKITRIVSTRVLVEYLQQTYAIA